MGVLSNCQKKDVFPFFVKTSYFQGSKIKHYAKSQAVT